MIIDILLWLLFSISFIRLVFVGVSFFPTLSKIDITDPLSFLDDNEKCEVCGRTKGEEINLFCESEKCINKKSD